MSLTHKQWLNVLELIDSLAGQEGQVPPACTVSLHELWRGANPAQQVLMKDRWSVEFVRKRLGVSLKTATKIVGEMTRKQREAEDLNWEREYNRSVVMFREHVKRTGRRNAGNNWDRGEPFGSSGNKAAVARIARRIDTRPQKTA